VVAELDIASAALGNAGCGARGTAQRARPRRPLRRPRAFVFGLLALAAAALALSVALATAAPAPQAGAGVIPACSAGAQSDREAVAPAPGAPQPSSFAVGLCVLRLVDASRVIHLPNGRTVPRALLTYVRYPALGAPGRTDFPDAPPARAYGPFPVVVFAHGFAVTPDLYARLLQSWARAGYVVIAPLFPLENADAPGGPNESDLINQPTDMSFVISRVLAAGSSNSGLLAGLVDSSHIAVAGHSDGAETALAVAYSRRFRDPRVDAAMILSGAEMSGIGGYSFPRGSPPLLAAQGTADAFNQPRFTNVFYHLARAPKYLLRLLGAGHLAPYTHQQPQLAVVERVTIAFMDGYLKRMPQAPQQLISLGSVPRTAAVLADP
jgi:dienelactone hydrolase